MSDDVMVSPEEARKARRAELEQRLAAIQTKRDELAQDEEDARLEQEVEDRARQLELEQEHGFNRILAVKFTSWKPGVGAATMFVCLLPDARGQYYKRMQQQLARNRDETEQQIEAVEQLARVCVKYPHPQNDQAMYSATLNLCPGVLGNLAAQIVAAVSGKEKQTKKG